jgi:glycosyltransferase involved in cell wall biosynthesis
MTEVSVIMPNFNKAPYLADAIRSVLAQPYAELELVLVDDGSTDSSLTITEGFAKSDSRLKLLKHESNRGFSAALNTGIGSASGELLTFMGSDDLFAPERVQRIVDHLPPVSWPSVIYSDPIYVQKETRVAAAVVSKASFRPTGMILKYLLRAGYKFMGGPISAPKMCFEAVGLYDESLSWGEDFDMALRLAEKFPFVFDPLSTYGYRIYDENKIRTIKKKDRWSQQGRILESHLMGNYDRLDEETRRLSFRYLFSCFVASGRWGGILRYGFTKEAGFRAMVSLPLRAGKKTTA